MYAATVHGAPAKPIKAARSLTSGQRSGHAMDGFVYRRQAFADFPRIEAGDIAGRGQGIEHRSLALRERHLLSERVGDQQDVGEYNRGVEIEAPQRLHAHLGCQRWRIAEIEEPVRP